MPLKPGTSKEVVQGNVKKEIEAGKDPKQAVAIAIQTAKSTKKEKKK